MLAGGLAPAAALAYRAATGTLGANPISEALNRLGLVALVFLIATLACTPLRQLFGWTWPPRLARMLGLFAFFYALAHFLTYLVLDQGLALRSVLADIAKRNFILVGFLALVLMTPLAVTSTDAMVRRLKFPRWKRLHRLAYACAVLGVIHFLMRVKKDLSEPALYGAVLAALFAVRLVQAFQAKETNSLPRP